MGGRATLPRMEREQILDIEAQPRRVSAWLLPVPLVGVILLQTVLGVVWLDNRLAPIAVLVEHEKEHDDRIAELTRRVEVVDDECRRYEWKGKR